MTDEAFEAVAYRFRALSDPLRLKILHNLGKEELSVTELVARTGSSQSNISKHLSLLLNHGLVQRRRAGTSAYYSIVDPFIFDLCDQVCGGIDRELENRRKAFH
jgi:DNA-binding transcriptional ArsR family regulator